MEQESGFLADDELLFRRIRPDHYDPERDDAPSLNGFRPHRTNDTTGLSVSREQYITAAECAGLGQGKEYYVAVLRAGDLRKHGIEVVPRPDPKRRGHAELPGLRADNRRMTEDLQLRLAHKLCLRVEGPYPGASSPNAR